MSVSLDRHRFRAWLAGRENTRPKDPVGRSRCVFSCPLAVWLESQAGCPVGVAGPFYQVLDTPLSPERRLPEWARTFQRWIDRTALREHAPISVARAIKVLDQIE